MRKLCLLGLSFVFISCGGGGGGSSQPTPTYTLGSPAILNVGDTFKYSVSGKAYVNGTQVDVSGNATIKVTQDNIQNPSGINCKEYTEDIYIEFTYQGQKYSDTFSYRTLFYQDNSGNFYNCGYYNLNQGNYVFITNSPDNLVLTRPANKTVGQTIQYRIDYADGSWEDCSYSVDSKEYVTVPYGKVESYKISGSCNDNEGNNILETEYENLSISPVVKAEVKGTNTDLTLSLVSKN